MWWVGGHRRRLDRRGVRKPGLHGHCAEHGQHGVCAASLHLCTARTHVEPQRRAPQTRQGGECECHVPRFPNLFGSCNVEGCYVNENLCKQQEIERSNCWGPCDTRAQRHPSLSLHRYSKATSRCWGMGTKTRTRMRQWRAILTPLCPTLIHLSPQSPGPSPQTPPFRETTSSPAGWVLGAHTLPSRGSRKVWLRTLPFQNWSIRVFRQLRSPTPDPGNRK